MGKKGKRNCIREMTTLTFPELGEGELAKVRIRKLEGSRRVAELCQVMTPMEVVKLVEMGMAVDHTPEDIEDIMNSGLIALCPTTEAEKHRLNLVLEALGVKSILGSKDEP